MIECEKCGRFCEQLIKVEQISTTLKWNGKKYQKKAEKKNVNYFCPTCKIEIPINIVNKFL
ncbi:MAG: hypothetical protein ACTSRG_16535 [Candidatus Helarchaeota archaeon]